MGTILDRLKEPSTWAGLSVLLGLFGVHFAPEVMTTIIQVLTGVAALAAIFMKEKGKTTPAA